jgi:hypothetical protein
MILLTRKSLFGFLILCLFTPAAYAGGYYIVSSDFAVVSPPCDGIESMLGWSGDFSYVGGRLAFSAGYGHGSSVYEDGAEYRRDWVTVGGGPRLWEFGAFLIYPTVLFSYGTSSQYNLYRGYFRYPEYHYGVSITDVNAKENSFLFGLAFGRYGGNWPALHLMFGVGWRQNTEKGLLVKTGKALDNKYDDVFVVDEWNYDMAFGMRLYSMLPIFGPVGISATFEGIIAPRDEVFIDWNQENFKKRVWTGRDITAWIGPSVAF